MVLYEPHVATQTDLIPEPVGLVRFGTRPTNPVDEQSACSQRVVPDELTL